MNDYNEEKELEFTEEGEKLASDSRERAKKIIKQVERARNAVGDRTLQIQELMAFYEGKQYNLSKYKQGRPWVVRMKTPYASVAVDTRVSSLVASDYRGVLVPMTPEDEYSTNALNNFIADEWERMNLNTKINESIKSAAIVRESYLHFIWEDKPLGKGASKRDGYIDVYQIDQPASVYIDPSANSLKDARFVAILNRMHLDDFKELYPEYAPYIANSGSKFNSYDRGEISFVKDFEVEQDGVLTVITYYERTSKMIKKSVVVEDMLVEEVDLDGLHTFPIAQMRWKRAFNNPYGIALMDDMVELQKAINAIESAITNTAVAYSAPSYAVRRGSGIDPKEVATSSGVPGLVFSVEGDIKNAIAPIDIPQLDAAIMNVKNDFIASIDRTAGITNPYLGSIGTSGNTAQGTRMAIERARIIEADVLHNIELFIEDISQILFSYIAANYSGTDIVSRKVDKITGDVAFQKVKLPKDLEETRFTFFVNLNTKTSYSKEREKEKILELYQMQNQYDDEIKLLNQLDVLEAYDISNKEALVERYMRMVQQTNEEKAKLITELMQSATELGIPKEEVEPAIQELLEGRDKTPITDQLMQKIEQMAQMAAQKQEQAMSGFKQEVGQAGVPTSQIEQMMSTMGQGGGL